MDKFYDKKDAGGTPSDSVRYILANRNTSESQITGELNILDIEPCYDSMNGYSLQESYIRMMIPKFRGTINITHMTTAEFIGSTEDLNSTYNMIFMGLDQGAYNTKYAWMDGKNGIYTYWNDSWMDGKIYFHTGDKVCGIITILFVFCGLVAVRLRKIRSIRICVSREMILRPLRRRS